ncbi:MAG: SPOR domain-containing protein [Oligoflexia bacterium]|nr:SPOR domain-containing protein [Oligoflexia bacterium]
MDEKNRVFIFDKKELALIFIFMILIAVTCFAFGVKIGKSFSLQKGGVVHVDKERVDLKSVEEEKMDDVTKKMMVSSREGVKPNVDKTYKKLEEEFEKINRTSMDDTPQDLSTQQSTQQSANNIASTSNVVDVANKSATASVASRSPSSVASTTLANTSAAANTAGSTGKFTIQIGSYQLESDAIKFADGFRIRGYSPIISEVRIPEKGVWYRVSIGSFNNISDAKDYISKEESLFGGQDYVITEFN